jgi:hypothetical protein
VVDDHGEAGRIAGLVQRQGAAVGKLDVRHPAQLPTFRCSRST